MSSPERPNTLLNLGDFVRDELSNQSGSPPVAIPSSSKRSNRRPINSAPAAAHQSTLLRGSSSLVAPVMDEGEILSTSASSTTSSMMQRHRDAAGWAAGGSGGGYGSIQQDAAGGKKDFTKSVSVEDTYVKIKERNEAKRLDHSTTNFQTFIHVIKGNIGTGLLALPLAVSNAGYILGPLGLFVMGIIATHCMILLLDVAGHLCRKNNMSCLNYAEAATVAVGTYTNNPKVIKASGILVNIFLVITQFGFCCVYFVFMADSLEQVLCEAFNVKLDKRALIAILAVPMILFCWIRNLESLSPFSLVANLCILFSLLVIFYEEIHSFVTHNKDEQAVVVSNRTDLKMFGTVKTIPLFFGSVVYAFEGIGMVLPLENKMMTPQSAKPVVYGAMSIVTMLYFIFGTTGYIVYGSSIKASITLNLYTKTRLWASIVFVVTKLYFAYAIFASYLLQFYVPMDFLEPAIFSLLKTDRFPYYFPRHHQRLKLFIQLAFRTAIVILTGVIAIGVPDLEDLIALIGAVASSALALIFPALLEIISFWPERNQRKLLWIFPWPVWVTKDVLILLLGIVGLIFGTYASISSIIANLKNGDKYVCDHPYPFYNP